MARTEVTRTITLAELAPAGKTDYTNSPKPIKGLLWLTCAIAVMGIAPARAQTALSQSSTVKIMTQNIDEGTDETFIVEALFGYLPLPEAVDLTYAELAASHLKERAALIARQIAAQKADIVALEEVALWRTGPDPQHATTPLYDQLAYLVEDLGKLGAPYVVAGINIPEDIALAGNQIGALRLTERNVLLVRAEFRWPPFYVSDVQSHVFSSVLTIGTLQVPAGWISATVHVGDKRFVLAMVHLESTVPGTDAATVQEAQAQELIQTLSSATVPVLDLRRLQLRRQRQSRCARPNADRRHDPGGGLHRCVEVAPQRRPWEYLEPLFGGSVANILPGADSCREDRPVLHTRHDRAYGRSGDRTSAGRLLAAGWIRPRGPRRNVCAVTWGRQSAWQDFW